MTFKKYFYLSIVFSVCIMATIVLFNIYMNEYGLFGNAKGKSIKIWHNERASKYLLSYNYIPANFEGMIIGPSLSDNLDTKKISGFKIYNASIRGGNVSELKSIVENVIQKGNIKFIIICLDPYITKNHEHKTSSMSRQEYWGSFGSKQILKIYCEKLFIKLNARYDFYNDYGYNNFNLTEEKQTDIMKKTTKSLNNNKDKAVTKDSGETVEFIDEDAYKDLSQIVNLSRQRGVKIFGFYYAYYIQNYSEAKFKSYKNRIDRIFTKQDVIWNMNTDEYYNFRNDPSNYYDKSHLSWKGADFLIREINNKLNMFYRRRLYDVNLPRS